MGSDQTKLVVAENWLPRGTRRHTVWMRMHELFVLRGRLAALAALAADGAYSVKTVRGSLFARELTNASRPSIQLPSGSQTCQTFVRFAKHPSGLSWKDWSN